MLENHCLKCFFLLQESVEKFSCINTNNIYFSLPSTLPYIFQHFVKTKTKKKSWMMTVPVSLSHSLLSWVLHYGTRRFHMTVTLSNWNTWTWRNFSQRMASHPAQLSMTIAHTSQLSSKLPQQHLLSWTSAAEHPHRSIQAWSLKTACRVQSGQVNQPQEPPQVGWGDSPLDDQTRKGFIIVCVSLASTGDVSCTQPVDHVCPFRS